MPVLFSFAFWVCVALAHNLSYRSPFLRTYVSELKHGDYAFLGYAAFGCLITMTGLASRQFFRWRYTGFGLIYGLTTLCLIGLMVTSASSTFHSILYVMLVLGVAIIYFADLHWNDNFTHLFLYINIWIAGFLGMCMWGPEFGQKFLILCFQGILIYHTLSCSPDTDLEPDVDTNEPITAQSS